MFNQFRLIVEVLRSWAYFLRFSIPIVSGPTNISIGQDYYAIYILERIYN